ncbi:hypothetical protein FACS1894122_07970 [Alphaproteobacteria bacterium]|nr:hypothetical protein FACS1894122_07970 [Alphaproteobacteria bacterium]
MWFNEKTIPYHTISYHVIYGSVFDQTCISNGAMLVLNGNFNAVDMKTKDNNDVMLMKHTAAIHISNILTLNQRKIANILLKNAYLELDEDKWHHMPVRELLDQLGWKNNSNFTEMIKADLSALNKTQLEWNILKRDRKKAWGITTFLADAEMKNGIISYSYSRAMRNSFRNPNIYAKLSLLVQKEFRSKYSLVLWEYVSSELDTCKKEQVLTDWISLNDIVRLFGLAEDKGCRLFKAINQKILVPSIKEINDKTNISIEIETQREGKKVVAVRFLIVRAAVSAPVLQLSADECASTLFNVKAELKRTSVLESATHAFSLAESVSTLQAHSAHAEARGKAISANTVRIKALMPEMLSLATTLGISKEKLQNDISMYGEERVKTAMEYTSKRVDAGKAINNVAAFYSVALRDNWADVVSSKTVKGTITKEKTDEQMNLFVGPDPFLKFMGGMRKALGDTIFGAWFSGCKFVSIVDGTMTIETDSDLKIDYIRNHYSSDIRKALTDESLNLEINMVVRDII